MGLSHTIDVETHCCNLLMQFVDRRVRIHPAHLDVGSVFEVLLGLVALLLHERTIEDDASDDVHEPRYSRGDLLALLLEGRVLRPAGDLRFNIACRGVDDLLDDGVA